MGIESAVASTYGYSLFLLACKEPILYITEKTKIYRFTYLRSFHNPIIIGIKTTMKRYPFIGKFLMEPKAMNREKE